MTNSDPMKCECVRWCREFQPGDVSEDGQEVLTHHPRCNGSAAAIERERDELREQVARLETERADWQYEANRLRAALEKYGSHDDLCCIWRADAGEGRCTCGLAEALKGAGQG